ncbi:esterase/lipase family protein [Streptomyces sp. NPDC053493]|uniref:esterase/lipase family protein n=1 Tax=Streptomyces sp. NPDC053493 TaxID=3365705 RepID=UPI0037D873A8
MANDLVVFVPGILGSELRDANGRDVWNLTPGVVGSVLFDMERYFERLTLPPGAGNEAPEGPYALSPGGLLREPRVWPGLMPHVAYKKLARHLGDLVAGRTVVFPYDWRLSNRWSAELLKAFVERELARWTEECRGRGETGERAPKVVYICHSMGGLVTRYYLEVLGGRETARSLVTLGTPYAGAVKAVQALTGTFPGRKVRAVPERLRTRLVEAARSMPSVHQLLPTYQCVAGHPDGTRLEDVSVPGLDTAMVDDAFAFRRTLDEHIRSNAEADRAAGRPEAYQLFASGGNGEPTDVLLRLSGGRIAYDDRLPGEPRWQGDGTVPCLSATPPDWPNGGRMDWFRLGHTALPNDAKLQRQLLDRYEALDHRPYQTLGTGFGVDVPEAVAKGEPVEVTAVSEESGLFLEGRLVSPADGEVLERRRLFPAEDGHYRATFTPPPGIWLVEVSAPRVTTASVQQETLVVLD